MTYSQAVSYLKNLQSAGIQMGLERMEYACTALSHPETAYPCVHIAGTNGKGSTAHMIAAALQANGYKVGLYTSPMLTEPTDMICINGQPITQDLFAACVSEVAHAVPQGLSEYECLTSTVFLAFQKECVDIAVIECCLGGETDATNVIPTPLCAVFTPIALDHTAILGDTIEQIAAIKSGIIKNGCDVICVPDMDPSALGVIFEKAAFTGSTVFQPQKPTAIPDNLFDNMFLYEDHPVTLRLIGQHQHANASIAMEVMKCLHRRGYRFDKTRTLLALEKVSIPCRQEIVSFDPFLMFDGAHNPHGIAALCHTLEHIRLTNSTLVIGMLADKDVEQSITMLAPHFEHIVCCTSSHPTRALAASDLAEIASRVHSKVCVIEDPVQAFAFAQKQSRAVVVGGSFYTASVVRHHILST